MIPLSSVRRCPAIILLKNQETLGVSIASAGKKDETRPSLMIPLSSVRRCPAIILLKN
jgi:hypothetical protein